MKTKLMMTLYRSDGFRVIHWKRIQKIEVQVGGNKVNVSEIKLRKNGEVILRTESGQLKTREDIQVEFTYDS